MNPSRAFPFSLRDPRLTALRAEVRAIECCGPGGGEWPVVPFGIAEVDDRLAAGGLAAGLHEVAAATPEPSDEAAATLFLAAAAARFSRARGRGQVLWALTRRDLFAPALALAGLAPDRVLYAECRDDAEALAVMEEGLRHGALAATLGEVARVDMAGARRLQLAAEESGTGALLLRRWRKTAGNPLAAPSAAVTRWRIGCAPSAPLPYPGVGRARWHVALARQRGGPPHDWLLEAPDAEARLALAALPADRSDPAAGTQRHAA